MKNHVLRPLWVAIVLALVFLLVRPFVVPDDFGVHGESFTYNYHRLSNIQDWKDFPVKYRGSEYCIECHEANVLEISASSHETIQCENCHGPAVGHPEEHETLRIDRSREHCLRCHQFLEYPDSNRASLPGVDGSRHKRRRDCSKCHDPHNPTGDT